MSNTGSYRFLNIKFTRDLRLELYFICQNATISSGLSQVLLQYGSPLWQHFELVALKPHKNNLLSQSKYQEEVLNQIIDSEFQAGYT